METVEVRFNVEDNGFFYQQVEYKDDPEVAIEGYIVLYYCT